METALQLLMKKLKDKHGLRIDLYDEFNEALELEKKQRIKDYDEGFYNGFRYSGKQYVDKSE